MATIEPAIEDPQFTTALGDYLTDEITGALALEERLQEPLANLDAFLTSALFGLLGIDEGTLGFLGQIDRPTLAALAGPIADELNGRIEMRVDQVMESNAMQELIPEVVRRAHQGATALIAGDIEETPNISIVEGEVRLNTLPIIARVLQEVVGELRDVLPDVNVPDAISDRVPRGSSPVQGVARRPGSRRLRADHAYVRGAADRGPGDRRPNRPLGMGHRDPHHHPDRRHGVRVADPSPHRHPTSDRDSGGVCRFCRGAQPCRVRAGRRDRQPGCGRNCRHPVRAPSLRSAQRDNRRDSDLDGRRVGALSRRPTPVGHHHRRQDEHRHARELGDRGHERMDRRSLRPAQDRCGRNRPARSLPHRIRMGHPPRDRRACSLSSSGGWHRPGTRPMRSPQIETVSDSEQIEANTDSESGV